MFKKIISLSLSFCLLLSLCCTTSYAALPNVTADTQVEEVNNDYHSETDLLNLMHRLGVVNEKKYKIPLGNDIIYIVTISETKETQETTNLSSKYVFERGEYYLESRAHQAPIMKDHMAVKFTYNKENYVHIKNPETDIMYGKNTNDSDNYNLGGYYQILYSTNQAIVSSISQLYEKQGAFNKLEYVDDNNIDIICDAKGNICVNSKAVYSEGENTKILFKDSKDINKKTTNDVKITSTNYNYLDQNADDNYKYVSVRMDSFLKDKKNSSLLESAYIEARFRYNNEHNECECVGTSYGSASFTPEKKSKGCCMGCAKQIDIANILNTNDETNVYSRSTNLTRQSSSASGFIKFDIPKSPDYQQNIILKCDSESHITYNID